jgi:hypothetical protein
MRKLQWFLSSWNSNLGRELSIIALVPLLIQSIWVVMEPTYEAIPCVEKTLFQLTCCIAKVSIDHTGVFLISHRREVHCRIHGSNLGLKVDREFGYKEHHLEQVHVIKITGGTKVCSLHMAFHYSSHV